MNKENSRFPLISIILPFYFRYELLTRAINSVINQDYFNWELILVNDGSAGVDLTSFLNADKRIRLIELDKNEGVARARNRGIIESRGEYIALLDSDDEFFPNKLSIQINMMIKEKSLFSHTSYVEISESNNQKIINTQDCNGYKFPEIAYNCSIATPTVIIHKSLCDDGELFPMDFSVAEDICAWLKLSETANILSIEQPLTNVYVYKSTTSKNLGKQVIGVFNVIKFVNSNLNLKSGGYFKTVLNLYKKLILLYMNELLKLFK